ncbi:hypothetical protein F0U59_23965 [Archangium gephyra]|nr:hypothetical protein F0U59_23965 [Archangium gephyra]
MQVSVREQPRRANGFVQGISMLVMAAMVCLSLRPLSAAAEARPNTGVRPVVEGALPPVQSRAPVSAMTTADDQYDQALEELKELVSAKPGQRQSVPGAAGLSTSGAQRRVQSISEKIQQLEKLDVAVDASFAEVGKRLDDKKLSKEIKARNHAAELAFKQKRKEMKRILEKFKAADAAGDEARREKSLEELGRFLAANQPDKRHKKLDPNKLPWRVSDGKARRPAQSPEVFARALARSSTPTGKRSGQVDTSSRTALAPATGGDLAETDDVQITQEIRDLAFLLGKNPVAIYNWVRNNINYVPSFGSIQGSAATLSKKQGNAFDTSSLLIALYRASGIPARYVYGTIQVPADVAMNWVGGVTNPEAAQQLWAQGGVPNVALTNAGRITHIELEHVWVEAWVDFAPSRGQKQRQGDTWVPLDASLKQYVSSGGFATTVSPPVDRNSITTAALVGATVNEAEGWVQNVNVSVLESGADQYASALNSYVQQTKPDATLGDVFGTRTISSEAREIFAASVPYKTITVGARYSDLPESLTHKFRYELHASGVGGLFDAPLLSFTDTLPNLAARKMTLAYVVASQADAELVMSFLPPPHADGSQPTPEEYSSVRLPAYLIRVKPELRVDGVVRATGGPITMGTELSGVGAFTMMDLVSGWDETSDALIAGQVTAIGLDMQGIDVKQLNRLKAQLEERKVKVQGGDISSGLTAGGISGDILSMLAWGYFAAVDAGGRMARGMSRVIDLPALSFGLVHADVDVSYSFGVARSIRASGFLVDIGHLRSIRWAADNDRFRWTEYNRVAGQYASSLEHQILDTFLTQPGTPGETISTVKLLAKASASGQRIYTVTQANFTTALPHLALPARTLEDIRSAVSAGKEVTVHERPIEINGSLEVGYAVLDVETGAGAYLIDGGANGGKLMLMALGGVLGALTGLFVTALLAAPAAIPLAAIPAGGVLAGLLLFGFVLAFHSLMFAMVLDNNSDYACFSGAFFFGFAETFHAIAWIARIVRYAGFLGGAGNVVAQCIGPVADPG